MEMNFKIIKNSESYSGYDIPDVEYKGQIEGLDCGWSFEFINSKGEISYNSVSYYPGTPEDYCEHWLQYGEDALFDIERWNGWEPTGRVVFRGYGEEHWDPEERDWYIVRVEV